MPSTTDNTATSHAVVPPTLPTSLVNQGMAVLKDMIGHIRLPADVQAERAALAALCLLSRSDLSSALDPINIELRGDLARLRRSEVAALRQWIYPWRLTSRPPWWMFRRRRLRHFHLFVLLGRVAAPLYQFEMIQELDALGPVRKRKTVITCWPGCPGFLRGSALGGWLKHISTLRWRRGTAIHLARIPGLALLSLTNSSDGRP